MRNLKHIYYLILVTVFLFTYGQVQGQSTALDWSYATFGEKAAWGEVVDVTIDETTGDVYEYGYTSSAGKPTTDGSVMNPGDGSFFSEYDFYVSKFDSDGNLIYRKYIGGSKYELSVIGAAQNGYFYMAGQTISTDYPVTDGSTFGGGASNADIAFTVIDPSGNIFFSTYIGGTEGDFLRGLEVLNDRIVIMGSVNSTTLPTTNSTTFGGGSDIYTIVYDLSMNVLASSYIGGNSTDNNPIMLRNNGKYFFIARTNSTDFPVTDGSSINSGVGSDYVFATLDDNLNIIDARFLGTVNSEQSIHREMLEVDDDYLYFAPPVRHSGLVTTNGTDVHTTNVYDIYFAKFNHDLSLSYATYFDYEHQQNGSNIRVENGEAYISMYTNGEAGMPNTSGIPANTSTVNSSSIYHDFYVMKIDQSNTIAYATFLGGSSTEQANYIGVEKGEMFLVGNTRSNRWFCISRFPRYYSVSIR
ncbi:MAG: hypothetical protein ACPG5P_04275 [Saprospiraceae bacterium]